MFVSLLFNILVLQIKSLPCSRSVALYENGIVSSISIIYFSDCQFVASSFVPDIILLIRTEFHSISEPLGTPVIPGEFHLEGVVPAQSGGPVVLDRSHEFYFLNYIEKTKYNETM